jgi:hypothetical protein
VGGMSSFGSSLSSAELFDPANGTWSRTGSLNTARMYHTATLLASGQVLVAGGTDYQYAGYTNLSSAELYDPVAGTWAVTDAMNVTRAWHTATLLANGKVLAAGGPDSSAELYTSLLPLITTQPQGQTVCAGSTVTFSVAASGYQLSYQWQKNGINLSNVGNVSGATTPTLTLSGVTSADAANYSVTVRNGAGVVSSQPAALLVSASCNPPTITSQPLSQTATAGSIVSFTVAANGGTPLVYQWQKNGVNLTDGVNVSGSATPTLTLQGISAADAGSYTVIVSNAGGYVTSSAATLVVSGSCSTSITTQPQSQSVNAGATVTFSVTAGPGSLTYQWRKNGINLSNGGNVSGATTSTLTLANVSSSDAGVYTVYVCGSSCCVLSQPAGLEVNGLFKVRITEPKDNANLP